MDAGPSLRMHYTYVRTYGDIATEGRRLHAVAHLAIARSQKTEAGISGLVHGIGSCFGRFGSRVNKRDMGSEQSLPVSIFTSLWKYKVMEG